MNNFNMALSLMDNIGTVSVIFANSVTDIDLNRLDFSMKKYTYCYDKSRFDLKAGDRVVVDGAGKYQVVTIVDVHKYVQINVDTNFSYKVITDVVEVNTEVQEKAEQIVELLRETQRRDARTKLLSEFAGALTDDTKAEFKALGINLE